MLIIPVLDLCHGFVVHAKKGEREHYKAITSIISASPKPVDVITAFLELYPFKTIYIADLDAIQGHKEQSELINRLALQFKQCEFWLDAGIEIIKNKKNQYTANNIKFIIGSENKLPIERLNTLIKDNPDVILSLDFNSNGFIENNYLLNDPSSWPRQLIVMMLHRVGSTEGVDFQCLNKILALSDHKEIYAAGGIRNINDLQHLKKIGINGSLLATALHNGVIGKEELNQICE